MRGLQRLPRLFAELLIQAGQHDSAVGQLRDNRQQIGRRRDAAGAAGRNNRGIGGMAAPMLSPCRQQHVAPRRRIDDAIFSQNFRPGAGQEFEKLERELPVLCVVLRHQVCQALEPEPLGLHLIEQARQLVGQVHRLIDGQLSASGGSGAFLNQPRQQQPPAHFTDRRGYLLRLRAGIVAHEIEFEGVLVDIANRSHARQQHRAPAAVTQKGLM